MTRTAGGHRPVDLHTAADQIGVHYQTAYKWVRAGRLPAQRVGGRYQLDPAEVERFAATRSRPGEPTVRRPRGGYPRLADRAFVQLTEGDESGFRKLVAGLLDNGVSLSTVMSEVLGPALVRVGERWSAGRLDIATEHRCSAIAERVVAEHMPTPRGRRRGTVVVAAPEGDAHTLPTTMAAAALREDNWNVEHLGADVPADELVAFTRRERPDLVVLTATAPASPERAEAARHAIAATGTPVLVGGSGRSLTELKSLAREGRSHGPG